MDTKQQQTFEFVTFEDAHRARSYAMRQSWRKRKQKRLQLEEQEGKQQQPKVKAIAKAKAKTNPKSRAKANDKSVSKSSGQVSQSLLPPRFPAQEAESGSEDIDAADIEYALGRLNEDETDVLLDFNNDALLLSLQNDVPFMDAMLADNVLSPLALDPFDTFPISLTTRHHELLHHWLTSHAGMMFGESPSPIDFNPMRDVWFPLDLSNAASFYGIMAHSAAHLAYLYGQKDALEVLKYKSEAVSLINGWMQDSATALSDATFAAIVRLLTFERYWGTEDVWRIHRDGLDRMIQARGGLSSLKENWRLGLVLQLISLMSKPSWFYPSNNISEISDSFNYLRISDPDSPDADTDTAAAATADSTIDTSVQNNPEIPKLRSLWLVSFIQDMRSLMANSSNLQSEGLRHYHSIYEAVTILRRSFQDSMRDGAEALANVYEHDRIACLFYIGVMTQECVSARYHNTVAGSPNTSNTNSPTTASPPPSSSDNQLVLSIDEKWYDRLATLDSAMHDQKSVWMASIAQLEGFLLNHFMNHLGNVNRAEYVLQMTEVLTSLSRQARNGVERCLLNMFSGRYVDYDYDLDAKSREWTVDELLMSIHGM